MNFIDTINYICTHSASDLWTIRGEHSSVEHLPSMKLVTDNDTSTLKKINYDEEVRYIINAPHPNYNNCVVSIALHKKYACLAELCIYSDGDIYLFDENSDYKIHEERIYDYGKEPFTEEEFFQKSLLHNFYGLTYKDYENIISFWKNSVLTYVDKYQGE